jgi:hypothetical protein
LPSFSELHKFIGELVGLLLTLFAAAELLLWTLKKLKGDGSNSKSPIPGLNRSVRRLRRILLDPFSGAGGILLGVMHMEPVGSPSDAR